MKQGHRRQTLDIPLMFALKNMCLIYRIAYATAKDRGFALCVCRFFG